MCTPGVKLGLYMPAGLHARMAAQAKACGGLQGAYEAAFGDLLDRLDTGASVLFAAVRGPKVRVTVRLCAVLCARLRDALTRLNLKVTDFACTAIDCFLLTREGA